MNGQLTISGVYEERREGCYMQKQFEKSFDVPEKADVDAMAAYITPAHMLVVEMPLNSTSHILPKKMDHLSIDANANNQRRLSFSLDKFNRLTNEGPNPSTLAAPSANQHVRRTSITKTTTTTTTSGSSGLPADVTQLLLGADKTNTNTHQIERRPSNSAQHQILINEPISPPAANPNTHTIITNPGRTIIDQCH